MSIRDIDKDFRQAAYEAGFSQKETEFMWEHLAQKPHTHTIDEVEGLEEALEGDDFEEGEEG